MQHQNQNNIYAINNFKEDCEQLKSYCTLNSRYLELRQDFSEEIKLLLLVDKLQLMVLIGELMAKQH